MTLKALPEWKTERVNAGSTGCRESTRWHVSRSGSTVPSCELTREHANPVASTFNPKVAGSIPARPTAETPAIGMSRARIRKPGAGRGRLIGRSNTRIADEPARSREGSSETRAEAQPAYPTRWPVAHWTTSTPRMRQLATTTIRSRRALLVTDASARNAGKSVKQNRGIDKSGYPRCGTLSGIARLPRTKSPYGAPKRRQARIPSHRKAMKKAKSSILCVAT
jgi:hypothetical protein